MNDSRRHIDLGLMAVVAVAIALRLPYLTGRSLWYDESSSWQTAKFALPDLMRSLRLNVHMPLYYLVLKGWIVLWGESVASLRGLSIALGVLTVVAMDRFAREVYRASADYPEAEGPAEARRFGLLAASLVALSPFQVMGSIEARMYSMGTALTAVSSLLLLRVLRVGGTNLWVAYGISTVSLLYTHHYAIFTVAAQFIFLGFYAISLHVRGERDELRRVLIPAVLVGSFVGIAYAPGLALLRSQAQRVEQDYWIRALSWKTFADTFKEFLVPIENYEYVSAGWVVLAAIIGAGLVVAERARRGEAFIMASASLPLLFSAEVSWFQPVWVARYFRFSHLFLLTIVALAAWRLTRRRRTARATAFAGLALLLLGANVAFWWKLNIPSGGGVREAVMTILERRKGDELIVVLDRFQYFPAKCYVGDRATIRLIEPSINPYLNWGWHLIRSEDLITLDDLQREVGRGVWVIGRYPSPAFLPGLAGASCTESFQFKYYHYLHRRIFVHHFERTAETSIRRRAAL